jgi:geranylgeranyl diphosphate synthase, type I
MTDHTATAPPVPEVIVRAREYVRPALEEAVSRLHPDTARICGYHLGWCDGEGVPLARRGSRSLQACMVMLAAEACGRDPHDALPAAVAVELIHNFSLIHDDIVDHDETRRGRPTAWVAFGTGPALLAGDALWTTALDVLFEAPGEAGAAAARELSASMRRVMYGWPAELAYNSTPPASIPFKDYEALAVAKGGELLGTSAVMSTLLVGGPKHLADALRDVAQHVAGGWHAVNDLEDLWGDSAVVGKPGRGDLRQRKMTLPLLAALRSGTPAAERLASVMVKEHLGEQDLDAIVRLTEAAGGKAHAENLARSHLEEALAALDVIPMPEGVRNDFADLVHFAITRQPRRRQRP